MAGGLLKGVAALMILAELSQGPKCGYEINSAISRRLGASLPPGYVYVMLRQLERRGLVEPLSQGGARRKKSYRITERGLAFLLQHEDKIDKLISILNYVKAALRQLGSVTPEKAINNASQG